jgi:hypothetical protein
MRRLALIVIAVNLSSIELGSAEISLAPGPYDCQTEKSINRHPQDRKDRTLTVSFGLDYGHPQAMEFNNSDAITNFVTKALPAALDYCSRQPNFGGNQMPPPIPPTHFRVVVAEGVRPGFPYDGRIDSNRFEALMPLSGNVVQIINNPIPRAYLDRERRREEARLADEAQKKKIQEMEKKKSIAIADCGNSPAMSGGPWFSSTYKIAAQDEARRAVAGGAFVCVKQIDYVSAAPNPFGGSAARGRFVGYDKVDYNSLTQIRDSPY